ncbi:MAG: cysteine--tRNA ligase [Verrucomicrobium sp.]
MSESANRLQLHDTLTRTTREVWPSEAGTLRFYGCGPTVYGPAHIGNFRTFVAQDVFRRVVELTGTPTLHVRNITDVDDKTIRDSQKAGQSLIEFTQYWTQKFHADCAALNLLPPHVEPKATDHIPHQVKMIEDLIQHGNAYAAPDGSVYFRVSSYADYGRLSHLEDRELKVGAAQTANDSDEYTKDSLADFALWKAHKTDDGDNFWESPWGKGRPGWHLECSAMALEYLGVEFDLHSGGIDLIFPHHENEIAQSCCATDGRFARHWMHIAHLMVDSGKMSKSLGNLYTLEDLKHRGFTPAEVRYTLLSGNYRQPLNFTLHSLDASHQALLKLAKFEKQLSQQAGATAGAAPAHAALSQSGKAGPFAAAWEALLDDLNVPGALGAVFGTINKLKPATLSPEEAANVWSGLHFILDALGLELPVVKAESDVEVPAEIQALGDQRWTAKQVRDWGTADELRKQIELAGWVVKDTKDGFTMVPQS